MDVTSDKGEIHVKHDWYQTETHVTITVLLRHLANDQTHVTFAPKTVTLQTLHPELGTYERTFHLSHPIAANECRYVITPSKIELKLKKTEGLRWAKLEGEASTDVGGHLNALPAGTSGPPQYPTSKVGMDWSAYERQLKEEESKEKPDGEEALNKLFQDIYGKGDDSIKRAMNKSYLESGGTVLSTNWGEISKEKVPVKPPDGMEFKKWQE